MEKIWQYGKKYGTIDKTMELYRKHGTLISFEKNDGTMVKTMVLQ